MLITKVSFHGSQISSFLNTVARDPDTSEGKEGSCRLPVSDDSVHPGGKGLLSRAVISSYFDPAWHCLPEDGTIPHCGGL